MNRNWLVSLLIFELAVWLARTGAFRAPRRGPQPFPLIQSISFNRAHLMKSSKKTVWPLALLRRQLADWQSLLIKLEAGQAPARQLDYCRAQIERLEAELRSLSN